MALKVTRILLMVVSLTVLSGSGGAVASPTPEPPGPLFAPGAETAIVRVYFPDRATGDQIFLAFEGQILATHYEQRYHILQVTREDLERLHAVGLQAERDDTYVAPRLVPPQASAQTIPGYSCYRTVEETYAAAEALVTAHPELATWSDVGDSWDKATAGGPAGYDLKVLRLTNSAITGDKPDLLITASIHAREYTPAEVATRFAEYLVNNYGIDADVTWILDYHEIHLMLQANPDGRKKAEAGQSWRKNTRDNCSYSLPPIGDGIDLNRNYAFKWGCCGGSSGSACNSTYRGASAGSEPETVAVQDYMASIFADQRGPLDTDAAPAEATGIYLDLHSYAELVLWPWGWTDTNAPNATQLQTLGRKFAYFNGYTPQEAYALYATDGTTDDYAYGIYGVAGYCIEMGTAFFQDCASFENTIYPGNLPALLYAARVARTPYLTPLGPDSLDLALSGSAVQQGAPLELTASINDTRYDNSNGTEPTQNIAAAEYYIDVPPWLGGTSQTMAPSDGSLDAKTEGVTAGIDTTPLSPGRHIVFVRGQDSSGNWGAFSAIFLQIDEPTAVALLSVSAAAEGSAITLRWEMATGAGYAGFNLYRAARAEGARALVNEDLIYCHVAPGSVAGSVYEYVDLPMKAGATCFYWLEAVDIHGNTTLYGPIRARMK